MNLRILIFCQLILSAGAVINGQKLYISPSGNDGNPGTREKPFATLNAACRSARELKKEKNPVVPVEIIAGDGIYQMFQPLELTGDDSGTKESPLVIRADEGAKPVFRGGVEVGSFEKVNDSLWKAFIPNTAYYDYYFEQLYVDGMRATRARYPNDGFHFVNKADEEVLVKGNGQIPLAAIQRIVLDPADTAFMKSVAENEMRDMLIVFYHKWDNTRKHPAGYDMTINTILTSGSGMQPWNTLDSKSRYYIENCREALDAPGEWFLDRSGYLYYVPLKGQAIGSTKFVIPVIKEFITIRGDSANGKKAENIRFENLAFEVAAYHTPPEGNEAAQAASPVGAAITADFAGNIRFINCEVSHTGTYAFWFRRGCEKCDVIHCYLHDLGAGGIKIGETVIRKGASDLTAFINIDNNIIRDCGHVFPCAVGIIVFNSSDNTLTHNDISGLRYTGISAGWVWGYSSSPSKRNRIEFNHIHHLGWGELCDMGGVYTLGPSEGTTVSGNVIHHVWSFDYGGWGLYTDEGSTGILEENNLVYACKSSGFHQHYGRENIIRNNIFALNTVAQLQATRVENHRSLSFTNNIIYFNHGTLLSGNWDKFSLISDSNCYWDTRTKDILFGGKKFQEWQKEGKDRNSLIKDPNFVDPLLYDFHFKNLTLIRKTGFKPFDYGKAGVYGSADWIRLAAADPDPGKKFEKLVSAYDAASK